MKYNKFPLESVTIKIPSLNTQYEINVKKSTKPRSYNIKYGFIQEEFDFKIMTSGEDWFKNATLTNLYEFLTFGYIIKALLNKKNAYMLANFNLLFIKEIDKKMYFEGIEIQLVTDIKRSKIHYILLDIFNEKNININKDIIYNTFCIDFIKYPEDLFEIAEVVSSVCKNSININYSFNTDAVKTYSDTDIITGNNIKIINSKEILLFAQRKYDLFIASQILVINRTYLILELAYQQIMFFYTVTALSVLNRGGVFILYSYDMYSDVTIQILAILANYFEEIYLHKSLIDVTTTADRFIICKGFKSIKNEELQKLYDLVDEWQVIDPSRGFKLNIKNNEYRAQYIDLRSFEETDSFTFINNLIDIHLPSNFTHIIKQFNSLVQSNQTGKMRQTINYNHSISILSDDRKIASYKNIFYEQQISALEYCKKYNIKINSYYANVNIKDNLLIGLTSFFPPTSDYTKLRVDYISQYSTTPYKQADIICNIIHKIMQTKELIITDATSNVGGNTISFLKYFNKVNGVEIGKNNYEMLLNNINVYNLQNKLVPYNNDYLEIKKNLRQDIIFFDPPWGGPVYKELIKIDLYLSGINIIDIINELKNNAKLIVLKIPKNYNYDSFFQRIFTQQVFFYKFTKYNVIFIKSNIYIL